MAKRTRAEHLKKCAMRIHPSPGREGGCNCGKYPGFTELKNMAADLYAKADKAPEGRAADLRQDAQNALNWAAVVEKEWEALQAQLGPTPEQRAAHQILIGLAETHAEKRKAKDDHPLPQRFFNLSFTYGLDEEQLIALDSDLNEVQLDEGKTRAEAEALLLKRIGGKGKLRGYVETLVTGRRKKAEGMIWGPCEICGSTISAGDKKASGDRALCPECLKNSRIKTVRMRIQIEVVAETDEEGFFAEDLEGEVKAICLSLGKVKGITTAFPPIWADVAEIDGRNLDGYDEGEAYRTIG